MSYSPQIALKCATFSIQAYKHDESVSNETMNFISVDGTQVLMIDEPEAIYVVFRGTTYEDVMTNLKARKDETGFGGVHRGFLGYVYAANPSVIKAMDEWNFVKKRPVIVAGHSLGGAAAVLSAAYLNHFGFDVAGIYTFGCPRVGNREFAKYMDTAFEGKHFRHINGHDGVPMVPPIHWGYRHCGQRFYFSTHKQRLVRNAPLCQILIERLPILLWKPWKWAQAKIIDHAVFLYESACKRNLEE